MAETFDAIVVGARCAGSPTALLLARKGYRIHLGIGIDSGYATCGFVGYEGRREYGVIGNVSNLAARLSDAAAPGEILVSSTVKALVVGSTHQFVDRGEHALKGVPEPWRLYAVTS